MPAPLAVQHHHAHIAAVMAEHGLDGGEPVLGIAFDGTGYGVPDGTIWGGEMLLADYRGFRRVGHLRAVPLPGGDAAVRNPARVALAHLHVAGVRWDPRLPCVAACTGEERMVLARMLESGAGCTTATSAGRLFDAVASLAGVRHTSTYEGQAAVELEAAGARAGAVEGYPVGLTAGSPLVLDTAPLMREAALDVLRGAAGAHISARFHAGLATASALAALRLAQQAGTDTVALGGGVFANMLLLDGITLQLQAAGMRVLTAERFPANDGGLALGQAAVASACASEP
jgi:hydrogenase maturation protein HypF